MRKLLSSHLENSSILVQDDKLWRVRVYLKELTTNMQREKNGKKRSDGFLRRKKDFQNRIWNRRFTDIK